MLEKGFTVPALSLPALPPPVSWFPLPPGWFMLATLGLAVLTMYFFFLIARWHRNRWRREARARLAESYTVDRWLGLIKQILLVHNPREIISNYLTPESLLQHVPLEPELRQLVCEKYCQQDNHLDTVPESHLREQLALWLKELPDV